MKRLFSFPNPVNEVSARLVAGGVVLQCVLLLASREPLLLVPLAYGFVARVLSGPTLSPLGQLVTRVITPALPLAERPVPGPPKRFAQGIGATLSVSALVAALAFGDTGLALVLVAMILVAASLESFLGYCLGCKLFALLMKVGVIPVEVCEACADLSLRRPAPPEGDHAVASDDALRGGGHRDRAAAGADRRHELGMDRRAAGPRRDRHPLPDEGRRQPRPHRCDPAPGARPQ